MKQLTCRFGLRLSVRLTPSATTGKRNRAYGASIVVRTTMQPTVDHKPAADERPDEQIQKVVNAAPLAHHEFGGAGRGGVFGKLDGQAGHGGDTSADVDVMPGFERLRRRAEEIAPAAQP